MRIGKKDIEQLVGDINSELRGIGAREIHLRSGYNLHGVSGAMNEDITGLLNNRELYQWLSGFERALNYVRVD